MLLLGSCVLVLLGCRLDKNGLVGRKIRNRGNWMLGLRMLLGRVRRTCERATSYELRCSEVANCESRVEIARAVVVAGSPDAWRNWEMGMMDGGVFRLPMSYPRE